jgi:hypothetical protein
MKSWADVSDDYRRCVENFVYREFVRVDSLLYEKRLEIAVIKESIPGFIDKMLATFGPNVDREEFMAGFREQIGAIEQVDAPIRNERAILQSAALALGFSPEIFNADDESPPAWDTLLPIAHDFVDAIFEEEVSRRRRDLYLKRLDSLGAAPMLSTIMEPLAAGGGATLAVGLVGGLKTAEDAKAASWSGIFAVIELARQHLKSLVPATTTATIAEAPQ